MNKILLSITLIFTLNLSVQTQDGWVWQNPLPQGNDMFDLELVNSTTAYALCFNSVMKSTNSGNNWSIYYTPPGQINISMHFINASTGFIVCDTGMVLRSTNGGVNWSTLYNFNQMKFNNIYFNDINTGYLIRYNDIYGYNGTTFYRTSNGGLNWSILINNTTFALRDIEFSNSQTGYIGGSGNSNGYAKVFKSTNNGMSWDSLFTNFSCRITGLEFRNNNLYVYGNKAYPSSRGMFISSNEGANWIPAEISSDVYDISYVDPNNIYVSAVNNGFFLYKSINNGLNWVNINSDIVALYFKFMNPASGIGVYHNGRIYKTSNSGINWQTNTTQLGSYIYGVDFPNENTGYAADSYKLLKTTNGGNNWYHILNKSLYRMDFTDANTGYCSGSDTLYKTTNGGLNWTNLNYGLMGQVNGMCFLNSNTGFILASPVKKTTNGGASWTNIYTYRGYPQCIYFYNENLGFIGEYDNSIFSWGITRTTNGGLNWDFQTIPTLNDYIYDFYFVNSNTGYFTTIGKIFKTTNSGNNWYNVCEGLTYYDIWSIQFLNETVGYAATSGGKVLKTTDAGNTWKIFQSIANYGFYDLYFTDVNTGYFVGGGGVIVKTTNGGGSPIGIEPISSNMPSSYELHQNFPNPFNPTTKIKFSIPASVNGRNEVTSLKIYDILGRAVDIPVNEILSPGEYEIEWHAVNQPSGIYFYVLNSGEFKKTGKMVLVK